MKKARHWAQYGAYRLLRRAVLLQPHRWARPCGRHFGRLFGSLAAAQRRRAAANLALALPDLPEAERRRLARECFAEVAAAAFETFSSTRFSPPELESRVEVVGREHLAAAERQGNGVFLMGAHLGCFEIGVHALALDGQPLHVVSDRLSNPLFDRELHRMRERFGLQIIAQQGAARLMYKIIAGGGRVLIAMDLRTRYEDAIAVPFFGRLSLTSPIPAFIALKRQTPVVPVFTYPRPGGRYRLELAPPILPRGSGRAGVAETTTLYLAAIERRIREHPESWVWMYRRWRPEWDDPDKVGSSLAIRPGRPGGGDDRG